MMNRIFAGSNIAIEVLPDRWRLFANGVGNEMLLAEATAFDGLRYGQTFGAQRRLPSSGKLAPDAVQRVVVGWSAKDAAWHLGLMLASDLAEARGSRWCELAAWPDPDSSRHQQAAARAGEALAQQLARPFTVVPPKNPPSTPPAPSYTEYSAPTVVPPSFPTAEPHPAALYPGLHPPVEAAPPPPMPALPNKLGVWLIRTTPDTLLELRLSPAWGRGKLLRVLWYVLWAAVFVVLSVTSLTRGIALPQPEFLPYIGLGASVVLILMAVGTLLQTFRRLNRIVIDPRARLVIGLRGSRERWRYSASDLQAVYASEIVSKINRRKGTRSVHFAELNLLSRDEKFLHLFSVDHVDEKVLLPAGTDEEAANADGVMPLTTYNAASRAQIIALYIARALGVSAFYDQRIK